MEELRFGKTNSEIDEDPAVLMARKTMKEYMVDSKEEKPKGPAPKCYGCGQEFEQGSKDLKLIYIKNIHSSRKLCPECIKHKDDIPERIEGRPERKPVTNAKLNPELQNGIETAEPAKKECLNCDCKLFFLLRGGVIKCSGCGTEFKAVK